MNSTPGHDLVPELQDKTFSLAGHFTLPPVGNFINRAAALKRKSYEALSGCVYGLPDFAFHPIG